MARILTGLVAFGLLATINACSGSKPDYKAKATLGTQDAIVSEGDKTPDKNDHGPDPLKPDDIAKVPTTPPAPPAPPTPPPPGALATPNAESFKKMMTNQQVYSVVRITNAQGWGTSAANPLTVNVAVDANGAAIPASAGTQLFLKTPLTAAAPIDYNNPPKLEFVNRQNAPATLTGMASVFVVCNDQATAIYLHADGGNGTPFNHGNSAIAQGQCAAFPALSANATAGRSYDHTAGNNPQNYVYLKVQKIGPDGNVVP